MVTLMVQGTTSDAGKTTLVAGLGRVLLRRKFVVAPMKPQNMALNSFVTTDGGEIGRAQAVQAFAMGQQPHTDMNPILLKPHSDVGAQVIIHGKVTGNMSASSYHEYKAMAMDAVMESYERLKEKYSIIIVEGAGSPAEINLRDRDIANMGFAEKADCDVVIVADIDKGGVFAHLVGTLDLLSKSEQDRVKGFFINKFRGDKSLLDPGLDWLEERTGKPVLGVIPMIQNFHMEAEDAIETKSLVAPLSRESVLNIAVLVYPRISNHTDFDPLRLHSQVHVTFVGPAMKIPPVDVIILPGTKSVVQDLAYLRDYGWDVAIKRHLRYGGKVLGVCGGYQMLGKEILDPLSIESELKQCSGLNIFSTMVTTLASEKTLKPQTKGRMVCDTSIEICGYEIHCGESTHKMTSPLFSLSDGSHEGACTEDDQVWGTYLHGLLEHSSFVNKFLQWGGLTIGDTLKTNIDYKDYCEKEIDRLADVLEKHLNWDKLNSLLTNE